MFVVFHEGVSALRSSLAPRNKLIREANLIATGGGSPCQQTAADRRRVGRSELPKETH